MGAHTPGPFLDFDDALKNVEQATRDRDEARAAAVAAQRETARLYQDRYARSEALMRFGTHMKGCGAVRVIGRFGSREGLRWANGDERKCDCGLRDGFQIHESGEHVRPYADLEAVPELLAAAEAALSFLKRIGCGEDVHDVARLGAAIAKARGGK